MALSDDLLEARHLISDPEHWIKFRMSRVLADGSEALCSLGAVHRVVQGSASAATRLFSSTGLSPVWVEYECMDREDRRRHDRMVQALADASERVWGPSLFSRCFSSSVVSNMNDLADHDQVMAVFDEAIRAAKEDG